MRECEIGSRKSALECLLLAAIVLGFSLQGMATEITANSAFPENSNQQGDHSAASHSPGVAEIIALVNAKIDPEVIKSFIQNSAIAYNPSATELIALTEHGTPADILVAMLNHGTDLRAKRLQAQPMVYPSAQTAVNPQTVYPADSYSYSTGSEPVYSSYPSYSYNSGWSWPVYSVPRLYPFGLRPYGFAHRPYFPGHGGGPMRMSSAVHSAPFGGHGMAPQGPRRGGAPAGHAGGASRGAAHSGGARPGGKR